MSKGKLYGIGVGPGDPELMTLKAVRILKECDVVGIPGKNPKEGTAYAIAVEAVPEIEVKEHCFVKTPMSADLTEWENAHREAALAIAKYLDDGKNLALLTLGDPTIYSTYIYIHRIIQKMGYETEIVSGIPSFCASAAVFGDSLVDGEEELHIIPACYNYEEALELPGTKVLMKVGKELADVKRILAGKNAEALLIENCGMENEKVYHSVAEMPDRGSYFSLMIVKKCEVN